PTFRPQPSQRQLPSRNFVDQAIGSAHLVHLPGRILGAPATGSGEVQVRETLTQHLNRFAPGQVGAFLEALRAVQHDGHVRVPIGDDARVLDVPRAELHEAAAMRTDWWLGQRHSAAAHHGEIHPVRQAMNVPHHHTKPAARRDVGGDAETNGRDRERDHDLHALAPAVAESLAVAPGRQLYARWLSHAHEVVAFPPNQRDLLRGGGDAAVTRGARNGLDALEAIVERGEIPAAAPGADDPERAFPFVKRDSPPDAEPRGTTITVK